MTSRERVLASMNFNAPDKVPAEYYYTPVGFYEHGEKLNDLFAAHEGDFEPYERKPIPVLGPELFDKDGLYHEWKRDEWGTLWEYRIYGIIGIEKEFPLDDWGKLSEYKFPAQPDWVTDPVAFEKKKQEIKAHQQNYFYRRGGFSLFERIKGLRNFEDVLCDLCADDENMIELLDRLTAYYEPQIDALIKMGVDSINFGDDYGMQYGLMFSKELFKTHFKPRYEKLMKPIREAGIKVHFHSCGKVDELFEDFKEMGVTSVWPQLPAYDMQYLADTLRDLQLGIALHTDRANTMTFGTPEQVRELVRKEFEIFRPDKGGSWFYIEADNGMPFENIKALVEEVYALRK